MTEIPEYPTNRRPLKTINTLPSKTEKAHQGRVNINSIAAKMKRGFEPPTRSGGLYGDFTSVEDFHTSLNKVNDAMNDFNGLPSQIRTAFANDPANLIAFLSDENNREMAIEMGLVDAPPVEPPVAPTDPVTPDPENPE